MTVSRTTGDTAWTVASIESLSKQIDTLKSDLNNLASLMHQRITDVETAEARRVEVAHTALNERLGLKDRWIVAQFESNEKSVHDLRLSTSSHMKAEREWIETKIFDVQQDIHRLEGMIATNMGTHQAAHREFHQITDIALTEFKSSVLVRIGEIGKLIDTLRLDSQKFVTGEVHHTSMGAISKQVDTVADSIRERVDTGLEQIRSGFETKLSAHDERIGRNETGISSLGASLRQTVIILGVAMGLIQFAFAYL